MAIINNAHPGSQINLLCSIYRVLYRNPSKFTQEELYELCRPESLFRSPDHQKRFRENLNFWHKESRQLWDIDADQKYYLLEKHETEPNISMISSVVYKKLFRVTETETTCDEDFLNTENKEIAPLYRTLAFILSMPTFAPPFWSENSELITKESLDSKLGTNFQEYRLNDSEKSYFLEYAHFLGFVEIQGSAGNYISDPTRVIMSILPLIFINDTILPISEFKIRLANLVPVLDGGFYRTEVEDILTSSSNMEHKETEFSKALSHALCRLKSNGVINFPKKKDDDKNVMDFSSAHNEPSVSEIRYMREAL